MHRVGGFKVGHPTSAPSKSIEEALRWTQGHMPSSRNKLATTSFEIDLKVTKQTCNEHSKNDPINLKPFICQTLKIWLCFGRSHALFSRNIKRNPLDSKNKQRQECTLERKSKDLF